MSFISLTKFCLLWQLLQAPREAVLLVKPQFEVGRSRVGKGVVRDPYDQANAIFQVLQAAQQMGWQYRLNLVALVVQRAILSISSGWEWIAKHQI